MATRKRRPRKRLTLPPDRPCGNTITGGTLVQSLAFDKSKHPRGEPKWTPASAQRWARGHGYVAPDVHETPNQYRVRQFDPGHCEYRTVSFGKSGISATVELPKRRVPAHVIDAVDERLLKHDLRRRGRA